MQYIVPIRWHTIPSVENNINYLSAIYNSRCTTYFSPSTK